MKAVAQRTLSCTDYTAWGKKKINSVAAFLAYRLSVFYTLNGLSQDISQHIKCKMMHCFMIYSPQPFFRYSHLLVNFSFWYHVVSG